ncbi:MAG: PaaI family thioesterase [bacterium]|nr:PaaI family thioesterase [bacterium]
MREEHYRKLERMYVSAPTNQYYRPTMVVGDDEAEILVAVRRDFFHAAGAVHGSVYFKLLDDSAYFAVNSRIEDVLVLTVTFHVTLMRPISEGEMRARGRVIHRSRRLWVADSVLVDSAGREISRGSGTFMRSRITLSPDVGYE